MRTDSIHFHSSSIHSWFPPILIEQAGNMISKLGEHAPECTVNYISRSSCGARETLDMEMLPQISSNGLHIHSEQKHINQARKQLTKEPNKPIN